MKWIDEQLSGPNARKYLVGAALILAMAIALTLMKGWDL